MRFWLLLIFALITQEGALFTSTLYLALQNHTNLWLIHFLFVIITFFDIWLGFHLGKFIDRKFLHGLKFQIWVKKHSGFLSKPSRMYFLIFTGIIDFPILNGVLGSWLNLPFSLVLLTTFIGDLVTYRIFWILALGVVQFNLNSYISIGVLILLAIVIVHTLLKYFEKETGETNS